MKRNKWIMIGQLFILLSVGMLFFGNVSFAAPSIQYGAETSAWTYYVPSYWTDANYDVDGGVEFESAESEISDARGHAQSSSALLAAYDIMPVLKAEAYHTSSPAKDGAIGHAYAIEAYQYTGAAPLDITVTGTLTGDVYNPDGSNSYNGIEARIFIFNEKNFYYCQDPGTLLYEYMATSKGDFRLELLETVTNGSVSDSLTFAVDPGEIFYLWASLDATGAWNNSYADAFSTLTLEFDDYGDLTAHALGDPAVVPIPAAIWLFGSGLIGLIGFKRRFRN